MLSIRSRNMHGALQELCRSITPADVIDMSNTDDEMSRLREPVSITLHKPNERMVFDRDEIPFQWFEALRDFLPDFCRLPPPSETFVARLNNTLCTFELDGWVILIRNDRGHLDMQVNTGGLHLCSISQHTFVLTMIQEFMAKQHKLPIGIFQFVFGQVMLPNGMEYVERFAKMPANENPYQISSCLPSELDMENLLAEVGIYPAMGIRNYWVRRIASPMWMAYAEMHSEEPDPVKVMSLAQKCDADDVKRCARLWLEDELNDE